jgi:hypothetical protein
MMDGASPSHRPVMAYYPPAHTPPSVAQTVSEDAPAASDSEFSLTSGSGPIDLPMPTGPRPLSLPGATPGASSRGRART